MGFVMVRRYGLRDDQLEKVEGLLSGREETVGVTAKDNRLFVETWFYRYRVASRGWIFRRGSWISWSSTRGTCVGANAASGSRCSNVLPKIMTTNTP